MNADPPTAKQTVSQAIRSLAEQLGDRPVFLSEVIRASRGRGYELFLLLLSLPFLTPIPLPLLSTPFGAIILLAGARLALGQKPWWPRWFRRKRLPPKFFASLLKAASHVVKGLEYVVRPRLRFLHSTALFQRIAGTLIALSGAMLLLPVPVPLSNFFPALTVVLLAAGALEEDGLFFLGGCTAFVCSATYFALLALGGVEAAKGLLALITRGG